MVDNRISIPIAIVILIFLLFGKWMVPFLQQEHVRTEAINLQQEQANSLAADKLPIKEAVCCKKVYKKILQNNPQAVAQANQKAQEQCDSFCETLFACTTACKEVTKTCMATSAASECSTQTTTCLLACGK